MKIAASTWMIPGKTFSEKMLAAKQYGFAGMEIRLPEEDANPENVQELICSLKDNTLTACSLLVPGSVFRLPLNNAEILAAKKKHAEFSLEIAAQIGCPAVLAPEYGSQTPPPLFDSLKRPSPEEFEFLIDFLSFAGAYAKKLGTQVLIEPLNRYETHFYYSLKDCQDCIDMVGNDSIKIMADFFHMNMEEGNISRSILDAKERIGHVQLGDSNRMLPGYGHTDFLPAFSALKAIHYSGFMALECKIPENPRVEFPQCIAHLNGLIAQA